MSTDVTSSSSNGAEDSSVRLSPTSYVVLGLVAVRGPSTSYDLKRAVSRSVGYFWPFPHSQLYSEPERLVRLGLLRVEREAGGRRRKVYSITGAGRAQMRRWLREPVGEPFQLRNVAELKLFFAELGEKGNVAALAREQVHLHEQRLAEFDLIDAKFSNRDGSSDDLAQRLIPLQLGRELELAALRFWRRLLDA